jgi:hypothetical protein
LRHTGHRAEALDAVAALQQIDPLDVHGMAERWMAAKSPTNFASLLSTVTEHPATVLEVVADYKLVVGKKGPKLTLTPPGFTLPEGNKLQSGGVLVSVGRTVCATTGQRWKIWHGPCP